MEDRQETCPMDVKLTSSAFVISQWNSLSLGAWCHRIASLVWLNSACNCWTVSCISYYAKNTDEQLGNVKDIHQSDCPHCQWFDKSLLAFWNYCLTVTKAGAIEGCQTWMSSTLSDTECMSSLKHEAIKILKLCVFLIVIFLLGLFHLDFSQVLRHEETVCPVYLPLFHSQYASHGHLPEEWI